MPADVLSLEKQIGFYAQYHHNKTNKWIHIVGVPCLMWSALFFASAIQLLPFHAGPSLTLSRLVVAAYLSYYVLLEPIATALYVPLVGSILLAAEAFHVVPRSGVYAGAVHAGAWAAQFLGHGLFEKRAPALLDGMFQSLVLAPLFVFLEMLFMLGYRPDLATRIDTDAARNIAAWRASADGLGRRPERGTASTSSKPVARGGSIEPSLPSCET